MGIYSCPHCEEVFEVDAVSDEIAFCPYCNQAVSLPEEEEISPGSRLGGFEIIRLIGKGGMGNVYLASQISMHREVALKVLPQKITQDKAAVEQFMKEVRMTGRMEHSNIVTAIDAGEHNGIYYLAMTYVNGKDLETVIDKSGPIQENDAVAYIIQIADALRYAWDKHKFLHRDIKPGNIMINSEGKAFLLDMGIALHASDALIQQNEQVEGSPFYMSPEQTRGEPLDWSSDLYSMGATLYHMITGEPPFDGEDVEKIVAMHSTEPFPDPREKKPDLNLSPEVVSLIRRMMGKKPHDRFSSWKNFIKAAEPLSKKEDKKIIIGDIQLLTTETEIVRKDDKSFLKSKWFVLLGSLAMAIIFCGMAFYMVKYLNNSKAKNALSAAESYQQTENYDYNKAITLFRQAENASKKMLVSGDIKKRSETGLKNALNTLEKTNNEKAEAEKLSNRIALLYSEANKLAMDADSIKDKNEKMKMFNEALEKCTEAKSSLNEVKTSSQSVKELIDMLSEKFKSLANTIKKKKTDFNRKENINKAKAELQAVSEGESVKEEPKEAAVPVEKIQNKKEELLNQFEKEKKNIYVNMIAHLREKDFDGFKKDLEPNEFTEALKSENEIEETFNSWLQNIKFYARTTEEIWNIICKSGTLYAKTKLKLPFGQEAEIVKIENGELFLKSPIQYKMNEKIRVANKLPLKHLETRYLLPIIRKACDENGGNDAMFSYMFCSGEFTFARKMKVEESQKKNLTEAIQAYLRSSLSLEIETIKAGKTNKKLEDLKERYETLPEYSKIIEELKNSSENKN